VIRCPKADGTVAGAYRLRNNWMIRGADLTMDGAFGVDAEAARPADRLHAFVKDEDFYRSGEWMTINIARKAGVEIVKDVLPRGSVG
jgi:hypothetical protein